MKKRNIQKLNYIVISFLILFIIYREYTRVNYCEEDQLPHGILNTVALEWASDNPKKMMAIQQFLDQNDIMYSDLVVEDMVQAYNKNIDVDLSDQFIGDFHTDNVSNVVNLFDDFIPKKLLLPNNSGNFYEVDIFFGKTQSDNMSAYQKVSNNLIEAIKHALTYANNKLYDNEKIKSIYIKCTLNGRRLGPSNHPFGNAVDISRINGRFMLQTGITRQIVLLQDGFNDYKYIRENFGPAYKHKYSLEKLIGQRWNRAYPVTGHRDHIHISVRK